MTLNWHWHGLTPSQKRSAIAGVCGAATLIVTNADAIERFVSSASLHDGKSVAATLVGLASLIVTVRSRALDSKNSGIGTGIVDNGPDERAQAAQEGLQGNARAMTAKGEQQ